MKNISRTYECSTKFCSYVTTGRVFQIALRGGEYSSQWEEWEILLERFFLFFFWSQIYLYTGIIKTFFQRITFFVLYTSNMILIFLRKVDLSHIFHCFILPWICP